ncbi:MAG: LytTR family DNA-binding domain-containing protein, partial [Bacillota bacterium]|nr:LytTR family DNA-binding domain-containing protein [Bacillota bacterium]
MINIIICDDQENQRRDLKGIIKSYLELKGLTCSFGEFANGGELLASPQEKAADIIFLDIEMPGIDGLETAKILRRRNNAAVIIFVTAYDD